MNVDIKRLDSAAGEFYAQLDTLLAWEQGCDAQVEQTVRDIIAAIRSRGDAECDPRYPGDPCEL